MTSEEIQAIDEIKGTKGFRVIEDLVYKQLDKLDRVSTLDLSSNNHLESSALARREAVKFLTEFLSEINLITKPDKNRRRTYE